jgi:hypothetical protein
VGHANRQAIGAKLALPAERSRKPMHGRMKEEKRFRQSLSHIDEMVEPPSVGQLMCQDRVENVRSGRFEPACRQKDRRLQHTREAWFVDARMNQNRWQFFYSEAPGQRSSPHPDRFLCEVGFLTQAVHGPTAQCEDPAAYHDAEKPGRHDKKAGLPKRVCEVSKAPNENVKGRIA